MGARSWCSLIPHHERQQFELFWRKMNLLASAPHQPEDRLKLPDPGSAVSGTLEAPGRLGISRKNPAPIVIFSGLARITV